ncbi:MAG: T9SS type A sorting domain-containing protein [Ferruginibacter sp.]
MITKFTSRVILILFIFNLQLCKTTSAQVSIRPYTQVYSENLRGSCLLFGNTSMHIVDADTISTFKIDQTGDPLNAVGGLGYSIYGNDNENMKFADIDATAPNLDVFTMGASGWRFLDNGSDQGTGWVGLIDPDTWKPGIASLGYGHAQQTTIGGGNLTAYFLKTINISDPALYESFDLSYSYDDGIVIYVNGHEVTRANMPVGTITYLTRATGPNYITGEHFSVPAAYFNPGANIIAVEIHQDDAASSNCYFDMSVKAIGRSTYNSSSADLVLPGGTNTIKFARLYWGGRLDNTAITAVPDTLRSILIRKGTTASYTLATAPATNVDLYALNADETIYQAYVDVTSFLQAHGAGTYTIANLPATEGNIDGGGKYAGWTIVVAYENAALNYNSVRIYDGYSRVYDFGVPVTQTIFLDGLNVPNNPLTSSEAVMSTMVWEGDANLAASPGNPAGDYLKLNNIAVTNTVNPVSNFWNGSISKNGNFITGTKNPDHFNQMGIDIDEMNVGTGYDIFPNATTAKVEFGTEADQYFPSIFTFSIRMKEPDVTLDKIVEDENHNGLVDPGEVLTYTLSGSNSGSGIAYNSYVLDSIPINVSYVANSLEVVSAPGVIAGIKTDADDADNAFKGTSTGRDYIKFFIGNNWTAGTGGELPPSGNYILKFKVRAPAIPGSVINTARITANSQAGDLFIDDGTAVISPAGGPTDVKLSLFTAILSGNNGLLHWTTESEMNNHHFDIERSDDATHFVVRGPVPGNGNSASIKNYNYIDPIHTNSKIVYYRLKMVDTDGRPTYSKIIALKLNGLPLSQFSTYPNPFKDDIKVFIKSNTDDNALFRIITIDGKELLNRRLPIQSGDNIIVLKDLDHLPVGAYILEVTSTSEKFVKKLLKQKF